MISKAAFLAALCLFAFHPVFAQQSQTQPQTRKHARTQTQPQSQPQTQVQIYTLRVFGDPDLRDPLTELGKLYERRNPAWKVNLEFENPPEIIGYLKTREPMDVFILADEKDIADLTSRHLIFPRSSTLLLSDEIVVAGLASRTTEIKEPKDLLFSDLKQVALMPENRGFGKESRAYLTKTGILASLTGKILEVKSIKEGMDRVKSGEAQWTLISASTAAENDELRVLWHVPREDMSADVFFAAIPAYSSQVNAAKSFIAILQSTIAGMIFRNAGYMVPETQPTQTRAGRQTQTQPSRHRHREKKPRAHHGNHKK